MIMIEAKPRCHEVGHYVLTNLEHFKVIEIVWSVNASKHYLMKLIW